MCFCLNSLITRHITHTIMELHFGNFVPCLFILHFFHLFFFLTFFLYLFFAFCLHLRNFFFVRLSSLAHKFYKSLCRTPLMTIKSPPWIKERVRSSLGFTEPHNLCHHSTRLQCTLLHKKSNSCYIFGKCVSVALGTQREMRMRRIVICFSLRIYCVLPPHLINGRTPPPPKTF